MTNLDIVIIKTWFSVRTSRSVKTYFAAAALGTVSRSGGLQTDLFGGSGVWSPPGRKEDYILRVRAGKSLARFIPVCAGPAPEVLH